MLLLFLIHMDLRTALTLWDRNACRFFDEEKVVKSSDWGGDNWSSSLSRSPLESRFWEQKKSWRERRSHQSQPCGQPCDRSASSRKPAAKKRSIKAGWSVKQEEGTFNCDSGLAEGASCCIASLAQVISCFTFGDGFDFQTHTPINKCDLCFCAGLQLPPVLHPLNLQWSRTNDVAFQTQLLALFHRNRLQRDVKLGCLGRLYRSPEKRSRTASESLGQECEEAERTETETGLKHCRNQRYEWLQGMGGFHSLA